eukprot:3430299-Rhodomonas_salina.3
MFANKPALQLVQALDPFSALNSPGLQGEHVPPSGPEYPASHTQDCFDGLSGAENVYAGHVLQDVPAEMFR